MTKLSARDRRLAAFFEGVSDWQLNRDFDAIGNDPANRVKSGPSKGHVKTSMAKYGDKILAELRRRRNLPR